MLIPSIFVTTLISFAISQESNEKQNDEPINKGEKPPLIYLGTTNPEFPQQNTIQPNVDLKQFYVGQQYSPYPYGLGSLERQYQTEGALPRLQPQIILYGPGGQGEPILINPGNPPGNFLIPQGPGPNVILRNNPQSPQGAVFPVAGYPKPGHIPPIEKDAEEIPTNPSMIPPLPSEGKPVIKPTRNKPEKLETFNEPNQPDQNIYANKGHFPQISPETVNLRPGQRFFILNGENLFTYPFDGQPQAQNDLQVLRYTNLQPFPQNPPNFSQTSAHESSQIFKDQEPVPVPNLHQRNSFFDFQQPELQSEPPKSQPQPAELQSQEPNQIESHGDDATKIAQPYFGHVFPTNLPEFYSYPRDYPVNPQGITIPLNKNIQKIQGVEGISSNHEVITPQVVGQFRFNPNSEPGVFPYKDDIENDAVVIDAIFDASSSYNGRGGNLQAEETESTTFKQPAQKETEPSMAQAGPQGTAIAGPGGVAGSAPRGTAIVGKGGLAVSSPQATAVAGTKDEDKNKKPAKKNN